MLEEEMEEQRRRAEAAAREDEERRKAEERQLRRFQQLQMEDIREREAEVSTDDVGFLRNH